MNASPLDNIRIVLSHTSHAGNIGAAARAMKTMGLRSLYLVNPVSFPDKEADIRAVSARDLLGRARVFNTIDEALEDTVFAAALTSRSRELEHETYDARVGAEILLKNAQHHPVALVFGAETSGLTAVEVSKCSVKIVIPTNPDYPSLNLASAVQVMAYELRMALMQAKPVKPKQTEPATLNEIELFYHHLEQIMIRVDFLNPQQPKKLMQRLRRLYARARLEKEELNILRGILKAVEKHLSSKP
ncbi:tRNA/rRNA methyltransferase [Nitrosomonas marina]|uniref:tRNA (cytidine/uridine-2'-O-)-methyltransferase TrmJ n=1 Tax=Nitrosomonas marina TaxID=917 RepID=A0A1I0DSL4_9PROT|nr:RNA methyltransferase [Nitrosomonas marina]SET35200.1 tRNA/rRNA methyltransferase [Nitrosomonas marina]